MAKLGDILQELKKINLSTKMVYTQKELAELLNTHEHKIIDLRMSGLIRSIKIGAVYNYTRQEVERFLKENDGRKLSNRKEMEND